MEACVVWLQRLTAYIDRDFQSSVVVEKKTHNNGLTTRRYVGTHNHFKSNNN